MCFGRDRFRCMSVSIYVYNEVFHSIIFCYDAYVHSFPVFGRSVWAFSLIISFLGYRFEVLIFDMSSILLYCSYKY